MARQQQVIHLHNTQTSGVNNGSLKSLLAVGELAMYNATKAENAQLYIKNADGSEIIPFVSQAYVDGVDTAIVNMFKDYQTKDNATTEHNNLKTVLAGIDKLEDFKEGKETTSTTVAGAKAYADALIEALNYTEVPTDKNVVTNITEENGIIEPSYGKFEISKNDNDLKQTVYTLTLDGGKQGEDIIVSKDFYSKNEVDEKIEGVRYEYSIENEFNKNETKPQVLVGELTDGNIVVDSRVFSVEKNSANGSHKFDLKLGEDVVASWEHETNSVLNKVELVSDVTVGSETYKHALKFTFDVADGTSEPIYVNVSTFLAEAEAGDGLSVDGNGVMNIVKASDSEDFLVINDDSIAVKGIQDAIENAIKEYYTKTESDAKFSIIENTVKDADGDDLYNLTANKISEEDKHLKVIGTTTDKHHGLHLGEVINEDDAATVSTLTYDEVKKYNILSVDVKDEKKKYWDEKQNVITVNNTNKYVELTFEDNVLCYGWRNH